MKFYIKTLGCEKNTVDSEYAAAFLCENGLEYTEDPYEADYVFVNTCGFINDAKQESINSLLELAADKREGQKVFATGCLSQRYGKELAKEMPEIDGFIGVNDYSRLMDLINGKIDAPLASPCSKVFEEFSGRLVTETPWMSPIKIAEGCNNICTYCAIPFMRGTYRSREPEAIIAEAEKLAAGGCRELVVIAQDTTNYGRDFGKDDMLPDLLRKLCRIDGIEWIRLMYCYEDEITDGLIKVIKEEPKICKYLDIPLQHCSDAVLKKMNRKSTKESIRFTINKLRKEIPDITIRTTLISGFPQETKEEFEELLSFVEEMRFERLGVFAYSKEDGTAAAKMKGQIRKDVKEKRRDRIMALQQHISLENNQKYIGSLQRVLVEEDCGDGTYIGRTSMDAPLVDNGVIFTSDRSIAAGEFVNVRINDAFDYDLSGTEE